MPATTHRKKLQLYLTEDEYAFVKAKAAQVRLSMSTYGKRILTGYEVKSLNSQDAILAVVQVNANLGRLGGLLKNGLKENTLQRTPAITKLINDIEADKKQLLQKVEGITMIAKKIHKKPENDCYRALALYICGLAKKEAHEKILDTWVRECEDPSDYMMGMYEIEATQAKNTRCQGLRTYHLVLSFRPEDENRLTPEIMRSIEEKFAQSLGFQEHQRLCGVHKNTNNMHMHVAYNMINKNFRKNEPFRDFYKLAKVRKEIELEFGLVVDNNIEVAEPKRENTQARTVEAHSGQESFDTYIRDRKSVILDKLDLAKNWNDVHMILFEHGIGIKPSGTSGLVLHNLRGKQHAKASTLSKTQTSKVRWKNDSEHLNLLNELKEKNLNVIPADLCSRTQIVISSMKNIRKPGPKKKQRMKK